MTNVLSQVAKQKFFTNNGAPAAGYKLFTYAAGTPNKLATYHGPTTASPNTNPIIMDFRGECDLWVPPNVAYKYVFALPTDTDPPGAPIWSVDNIIDSQLITLYGGVDTGVANAYVLNFVANFTAYQDGIVIYWIPSNTNTGASTVNVNGLGAVSILNQDGTTLVAGQLAANRVAVMIYKGTGFLVLASDAQTVWGGTSTGTSGAYVLNASQYPAYREGLLIYWVPNVTYSGGGCTINVNGLGSRSIFNPDGSILAANQIRANEVVAIIFVGSSFILLTSPFLSGTFTGTLTGMTGSVTASVQYYVSGNIVSLSFVNKTLDKTGTSNTTAMKMTGLPNLINPAGISTAFCGYVINNGSILSTQAQVFGNEISFFLGFDGTTLFTGSGTKGLNKNWGLVYQLN